MPGRPTTCVVFSNVAPGSALMARTLVFDVNETLLDLAALDDLFGEFFGDAAVRREWFAVVLRNAMTMTITGDQSNFVDIAGASLQMVAETRGVELPASALGDIAAGMRTLPPHPDVVPGLTALADSGLTMVALTNSPLATAEAQIANAGLREFFSDVLSVESTGRFKPAAQVYHHAAEVLGTTPADLRLVAAHDWDIVGAMRTGYAGVLITREGVAVNPLYPHPDIVAPDLIVAAEAVVAAER